jgi:CxxC motif-containing protein (DUF1111 family)
MSPDVCRTILVLAALSLAACGGSLVTSEPGSGDGDGDEPGDGDGDDPGDGDGDGPGDGDGDDPGDGDGDDPGDGDGDGDTMTETGHDIVPLYGDDTELEPEIHFDRGDAIVTRFGDRGRDRHAREDQFQSYDHYLPHYWEHRTARYMLVDKVAKGGNSIEVSFVSEWRLSIAEFRAWYLGRGTVANYSGNFAPGFDEEGPGTFDNDLVMVSDEGDQFKYTFTITSAIDLNGQHRPLEVGQFMEFESSQFLDAPPIGRTNYYGTTYLYEVGRGGLVPWYTVGDFADQSSEREDSRKLDEKFWLGGRTTLPYQYSDEPDNHYMQMATNLSSVNAQTFVNGRRVHHTDMLDGHHDESAENGIFNELVGLAGPNFVNQSCDGCHKRNGRAPVAGVGDSLEKWVFKVAAADGKKDPLLGGVLQPRAASGGTSSEGQVSISEWLTNGEGLRAPVYAFSGSQPALFSARIAPSLVGLGLLEAVAESTVLGLEDVNDDDDDGISGKAQISIDPVTGDKRLGRFGWKAGAGSLKHQIAAALNTDMGVMTSVLPVPDCGDAQQGCGNEGAELSDARFEELVKYVALLGVRARRGHDDSTAARGEEVFEEVGCASCHVTELRTSKFHPLAELRDQVIRPYTDLLLHDMGEGLADNLGEGEASGAEWRTTPLWGIGLSACVTGGVTGPFQDQVCTPNAAYLHDGRARTIEEAILWHGGEGQAAKDAFKSLSSGDKSALLRFLETL